MHPHGSRSMAAAFGITLWLAAALPLSAHKTQTVGKLRITLGWGEEPAFTGSRNFVSLSVTDPAGAPVTDPAGALAVEIAFGDDRVTLPLQPSGRPGEFRAWLVPTRAGAYTFHITGRIKDQSIDFTSTCSDTTFDCVVDASDIQFPAKDPSAGQLADRISRSLPRADRAIDAAARAQTLSLAAIALAGVALAAAIGFGLRRGR